MATTTSTIKTIMAVSIRSPHVRGAARRYRYTGSGVYEAEPRANGRGWYWSGPVATGPDRRSDRLAEQDADGLAAERGCDVLSYRGSIRGTDATEYVWGQLSAKEREEHRARYDAWRIPHEAEVAASAARRAAYAAQLATDEDMARVRHWLSLRMPAYERLCLCGRLDTTPDGWTHLRPAAVMTRMHCQNCGAPLCPPIR